MVGVVFVLIVSYKGFRYGQFTTEAPLSCHTSQTTDWVEAINGTHMIDNRKAALPVTEVMAENNRICEERLKPVHNFWR